MNIYILLFCIYVSIVCSGGYRSHRSHRSYRSYRSHRSHRHYEFAFINARRPQLNINAKQNIIINLDDIIRLYKSKCLIEMMTHIMPPLSRYENIEFVISEAKLNEVFVNKNQLMVKSSNLSNLYHDCALQDLKILGEKINADFSVIYVNQESAENNDKYIIKNYLALDYYISRIASISNDAAAASISSDAYAVAATNYSDAYAVASDAYTVASDAYTVATNYSDAYTVATNYSDAYAVASDAYAVASDAYAVATNYSDAYAVAAAATTSNIDIIKNAGISLLKPYWNLSLPIKILKLKKNRKMSFRKISWIKYDTNILHIYNTSTFFIGS
jgi:hypothetical protein